MSVQVFDRVIWRLCRAARSRSRFRTEPRGVREWPVAKEQYLAVMALARRWLGRVDVLRSMPRTERSLLSKRKGRLSAEALREVFSQPVGEASGLVDHGVEGHHHQVVFP